VKKRAALSARAHFWKMSHYDPASRVLLLNADTLFGYC
jgi:hypothetical protein